VTSTMNLPSSTGDSAGGRGDRTPGSRIGEEMISRLIRQVQTVEPREMRRSTAPFTGETVGETPACTAEDVDAAVKRARAAQGAWAKRPVSERAAIFLRYHDMLLDRQDLFLDVIQTETGKARTWAFEELLDVAMTSRYYADHAAGFLKPKSRRGALPGLTSAVEYAHPKGVVGVISPWNYPLTLAVSDAIPALLAGNAVVIKPDAQTPLIALLAIELLVEAGLPADLFIPVTGAGKEIGTPLIDRVDYMMFTGSTETGKAIAVQCAKRLIDFSAELGGKNPMIVCADAPLKKTIEGAVRACFSNSGQLCISIERMYVEDAIYDRFVPAFAGRVKKMVMNAAYDFSAEMGSIVSEDQLKVVSEHVEDAKAKGATVLAGGRARPDLGPLFYEPTVLTGVTEEMELARNETFGPVVAITRVPDVETALEIANDTTYGLNASIWTSDYHRGQQLATRIQAGTVNINEGYSAAWASHDAPMGGMKDSGVGRRHGEKGLLKYTESQTVATQRVMGIAPPPGVSRKRFAQAMTLGLRLMKRIPGL
jgi:succinate-semialdehyde dehydrogenase/glutarate-semialdehyde dehydrogenase